MLSGLKTPLVELKGATGALLDWVRILVMAGFVAVRFLVGV